jgi:hypothetical protein
MCGAVKSRLGTSENLGLPVLWTWPARARDRRKTESVTHTHYTRATGRLPSGDVPFF